MLLENKNDSGEQCIKIMQVFRIFHRRHPLAQIVVHDVSETKARFPLGDFVRANRQKSRNAPYLFAANFFASQFQPITLLDSCFRFASREQIRLVENGLNNHVITDH